MHHAVVDHDLRTEGVADALVTEANAKQRNVRSEGPDDFVGESRFTRGTRSGRDEDAFGFERADLFDGDLVVAMDLHIHLHLAQILDEIVGERIVIIYDQHHNRPANLADLGREERAK